MKSDDQWSSYNSAMLIYLIKLKALIMKKFILILIASIGISFYLSAQSAGDYTSIGSGNWNDPTKWETYNGSSWITALTYPGENPGTGLVSITNETAIIIMATVPNPVSSLYVSAEYACSCDNYSYVPLGKLTFSAENSISLIVTTSVAIYGELLIDNQNGAKSHSIFIGGGLWLGDGYGTMMGSEYAEFYTPTIFQTINQDDKINFTFNTAVPNSVIGGFEVSFQDVTFNGIGIQGGGLVNGHANFINGKVKGGITFMDGATHSGASVASFVEGWVTKEGDEAFTFPIGRNGIYAPLTISAPVGQTESFIASYVRSDAEGLGIITDPGLFSVSNCEYWNLQPGSSSSNNYSLDITVGWTSASGCGSSPYINNVSDVTLAGFNNTNSWGSHGGSGIGTTTNGSVTSTGVNAFGSFTLGNLGSCAAPFELNTTNITPNSATVNWSALTSSVSYSVEYSVAGSGIWINAASSTTSKSVNLTGLSPATVYYWRIRSNCTLASSTYRLLQFATPIACGDPAGLSTANITSGGATLTWGAVPNALNYDVEYRQSSLNTWIRAVTGTTSVSYNLSGLSELTSYDWHVHANCSAGAGNYIQASFTSLRDCNNIYEPNNNSKQAKEIYLGNAIYAGISTVSDVDWFKVTVPNHYNNTMLFSLFNLPMDYDLYVYSNTLKLLGSSTLTGTSNESVVYNSTSRRATYYIKVVGKNGAYNTTQCYSLGAQLSSTAGSASGKSYPANEVTDISDKQLLYPNPASEFVYLNFNSTTEELINIQIVNSISQLVKQHPVNTIKGPNQIKIQVADIRPGMYILRINKGELNMVRKFVIAR
jgi:hypothetical protein